MLIVAANDNGGVDDLGRCAVLYRHSQWRVRSNECVHVLPELRPIPAVAKGRSTLRNLWLRSIFRKYYAIRVSVSVRVQSTQLT